MGPQTGSKNSVIRVRASPHSVKRWHSTPNIHAADGGHGSDGHLYKSQKVVVVVRRELLQALLEATSHITQVSDLKTGGARGVEDQTRARRRAQLRGARCSAKTTLVMPLSVPLTDASSSWSQRSMPRMAVSGLFSSNSKAGVKR